MNSGFSVRDKCTRWLMATVIVLWAVTGTAAMPLMSEAECHDMAMGAGYDQTHHAATPHHPSKQNSAPQHDCCKKKAKGKPGPAKAAMPGCPMDEGQMPRSCGMAEVSCCAVMGREETRRSAKPEYSRENDAPALLLTKARRGLLTPSFDHRDRHLSDGLRYEKPVFDLKTDLRV